MFRTKMNIEEELFKEIYRNDKAFQEISKKYVSLDENKKKLNNQILRIVLEKLLPAMAESDKKFKKMSQGCMYGGSYYKRLKVCEPDEFDINLIMKLPINYNKLQVVTLNVNPGYVKIKLTDKSHLHKSDLDVLSTFLDDGYLDQDKFRNWMQGVLVKALNTCNVNRRGDFVIELGRIKPVTVNYSQSNPAFTLLIRRDDGVEFDVDLVPCLIFHDEVLLGFTPHIKNIWITVAKPLQSEDIQKSNLLWRVGFYKDEKEMVKGQIKPIIRLMKKFRDVQKWSDIKSYYIETLFLHELDDNKFKSLYKRASRTCVFMYMLKRFREKLRSGVILNYWHSKHNLLEKINEIRLTNIANELDYIINNIEHNIKSDLSVLYQYFNGDS